MDFLPDKEFHKLFDRISERVNLRDAATPYEINERLNQKIEEYGYLCGTDPLAPLRAMSRTSHLRSLIMAGFGRRTIDEAIANPQGEVALTLKYGRKKAKEILLKRTHRRLRW